MTVERLKILLANYISDDLEATESYWVLQTLWRIGMTEEEIEELGYDWLIELVEESEENN